MTKTLLKTEANKQVVVPDNYKISPMQVNEILSHIKITTATKLSRSLLISMQNIKHRRQSANATKTA
jgi:hypothetical protein